MKEKSIIIAIVGKSGSGKTTLSHYLESNEGIPAICSYTTRPMRPGEINGKDHWFVNSFNLSPLDTLAYTYFGNNHYWTISTQVSIHKVCSYVIDEKGLIELYERWHPYYEIVSVYIHRPDREGVDEDRKNRDYGRISFNGYYDITIDNETDLETFCQTATSTIISFLNKNYGFSQN